MNCSLYIVAYIYKKSLKYKKNKLKTVITNGSSKVAKGQIPDLIPDAADIMGTKIDSLRGQ